MVRHLPVSVSIAIVASLAITGCVAGPPAAPGELSWILEEGDAISVTPTINESLSASAPMTIAEGGTVSATGADGTTYTLTIPPDALRSNVTITMTPLASIDGLPFGEGPAIGVQLEPSGLQLDAFATLDIDGQQVPAVSEQILYSYRGTGEALALAAPDLTVEGTRILLDHFSGYGVGNGLLTDIEPIRKRLGGEAFDKLTTAVAAALFVERSAIYLGSDVERVDLSPYWAIFEEQILKPRLDAAGDSCGNSLLAQQTAMGYVRQRQLLGEEDFTLDYPGGWRSLVVLGARACLEEEYDLCRVDHIVHRMIPFWLGLQRSFALLGVGDEDASVLAEAEQKVRDCLTFSIEYSSNTSGDTDEVLVTSDVQAKAKITFDTQAIKFTSDTVPLKNTSFTLELAECTFAETTGDGTFAVENMILEPSKFDMAPPADGSEPKIGKIERIDLRLTLGLTSESAIQTCYGESFAYPPIPWWFTIASDASGPSFSQLTEWEILGGAVFATSTWSRAGELGLDEGEAILNHEPKK